ncbi:MAG: response regulator [Planctomycetota bacterium]
MRVLLVDDDEQVLRGLSRMLEIEMDDWEIETATSGVDCLAMLEEIRIDVVVADMRMPGMDGAELLERISSLYPRMLRIVLSGQADRETVLRAVRPMHQYLSKPCNPEELIEVIEKAASMQETIHSAEVLDAIGRKNCLPSLPEYVVRINEVLESEFSTSRSIARELSQDPAVAARVLQLANSAIFGFHSPIIELERAVGVVGSEMIRALVLSQSVFGSAPEDLNEITNEIYEHSFEVAVLAKKLCLERTCDTDEADAAFTGGLLHDLGKIIMINAFPRRWEKLVAEARSPDELSSLELQEFGASHEGIGAYVLDRWGLPPAVVNIVASHHSPVLCAHGSLARQAVFAVNWYCRGASELDSSHWLEEVTDSEVLNQWRERLEDFEEVLHSIAPEACHA